MLLCKASNKYV